MPFSPLCLPSPWPSTWEPPPLPSAGVRIFPGGAVPTPEGIYLLPNAPNTREDYLDALTEAGCRLLNVQDIALDGGPYGDVSEAVMKGKGLPPLCLVVLAQKHGGVCPPA